jgi:hypothetical protein
MIPLALEVPRTALASGGGCGAVPHGRELALEGVIDACLLLPLVLGFSEENKQRPELLQLLSLWVASQRDLAPGIRMV